MARVEAALGSSLAGLADDAAGAPLDRRLERVHALAEEVRSLRPLPGQLAAEPDARTGAEAELARVGGRVATLTGERDGLAAALGTAKAQLSGIDDLPRLAGPGAASVIHDIGAMTSGRT